MFINIVDTLRKIHYYLLPIHKSENISKTLK